MLGIPKEEKMFKQRRVNTWKTKEMNFPELKKNKQLQIEGLTDCQTGDRKIHTIRKF